VRENKAALRKLCVVLRSCTVEHLRGNAG